MTTETSQVNERSNLHGPAEIKARDIRFEELDNVNMHNWHSGNPIITQLFNGLSLIFPDGEEGFMHSVRLHGKEINDPQLKRHVKGFLTQEALHTREHEAYNDAVLAQGIPAQRILDQNKFMVEWAKEKLPRSFQLANTVAAEHFTAVLADKFLTDERMMANAPDVMKEVWHWHAVEETEHKAVAFDVFKAAYPGFKGYLLRSSAMLLTLLTLIPSLFLIIHALMKGVDEKPTFKQRLQAWKFFWVGPGFFSLVIWKSIEYFKPSFHPWDHENFHHIEEWNAAHAEAQ